MGSKVKCTCGWSWNKSDSSKKDMYICHECGRDNSNNMKNGGWLDNYNDYKVSAPEGMVGDGFSNVGRNYSPAWGGQFAMGGSIPGSVGFTYARTQGIPSEGKYAKKTLPSAQNGHEMSFYQNGLDWTPKNISKNGSVIKDDRWKRDVTPVYQQGGYIPKAQSGIKQSKLDDIYQNDLAKQKFEKFGEFRDTLEGTDEVMYGTPEYEKAYKEGRFADVPNQLDEITISPYTKQFPYYEQLTPNEKKHLRKNINSNDPITRQLKARAVDGRGFDADKAKDFAMAYMRDIPLATLGAPQSVLVEGIEAIRGNEYNPLNAITPGSQRVPSETFLKDASPGWQLAGDMLIDVPLVGSAANAARKPIQKGMQQLKNIAPSSIKTLPQAKNIKEALGTFAGIPTERSLPRLSPKELKIYRQAQEIGRMRSTGKPISEQYRYAIEQGVPEEHLQQIFKKSKSEIESVISPVTDDLYLQMPSSLRARLQALQNQNRYNSNLDNTFAQLDAGTHSSQRDNVIRNTLSDFDIDGITNQLNPIPEELILNTGSRTLIPGQRQGMSLSDSFYAKNADLQRNIYNNLQSYKNKIITNTQDYPGYSGPVLENVPSLSLSSSGSLKGVSNKVTGQSTSGINSGDVFTGSLNTSHSSYLPQLKQVFKYGEGSPQFLGYKPMNQMGFLSDFNYSADDIAKYLNTEIDEQIKRGIIPKNVSRPFSKNTSVALPHYGVKQYKQGGIIKDDRGQWNHPGEITEINSPYITMKGVPYPVLGISDTGDMQMMYPEEEYEFDGNKVIEYPLAKNGINNLDAKPLQKLNQLTNFTNYNKPTVGGWLNKYSS